jgi:hypothetical protein
MMISSARRQAIQVVRWISLPLAVFCLVGPLWALASDYRYYAGMIPTDARVISATLRAAGAKDIGALYDSYVQYTVAGHIAHDNVTVSVSFRRLSAGDTIRLFVDPKTGRAEDSTLPESWLFLAIGTLTSVFFVMVGFRYSGAVLRGKPVQLRYPGR